jgi:hypothetical protein
MTMVSEPLIVMVREADQADEHNKPMASIVIKTELHTFFFPVFRIIVSPFFSVCP